MIKLDLIIPAIDIHIPFLDFTCEQLFKLAELNNIQKLCFVTHEIIINAVEATKNICDDDNKTGELRLNIEITDKEIKVLVIDEGDGIPDTVWNNLWNIDLEDTLCLGRGRGLLLVKEMVDEIWHENNDKHTLGISIKRGE